VRRVSVVGTTASGKTTFAGELARVLGVAHVELDALNWGPNWTMVDEGLFRRRVDTATSADGWVVDGNYGGRGAREIVWGRADTVVWLDPPLPLVLVRLWRRSVGRIRSGYVLWGGNRETFRNTFLSRQSLFVWALKTHRSRKRAFQRELALPQHAHLQVHRFTRPADAERWLQTQRAAGPSRI
jgi:adenylate kinase family enzyme